ncbi:TolC family outer membrane protein [Ideonella sp. A 288]|uniref:TolC family outer membrane protein n=1 Tax=Ideonella sp. A 288 TaxID=1962181 RepID=UPI001303F334|nr:TolC family outer membrane protein [Ideonella sp. A 288]
MSVIDRSGRRAARAAGSPCKVPRRLVWLALMALSSGAQAMSFAEAYEAARGHDARYRAANHELTAARQGVPVARAALLPTVNLNVSESSVLGTRRIANGSNQDVRLRVDYDAPQTSVTLRMPLFNREASSVYQQAQAQSEVAESVYRGQGLDLVDRLAVAYLQALLAEEGKRLVDAQEQALIVQLQQAERRLERGEGTRVNVAQGRAALDLTRARQIDAQDQVELARRALRRVTGLPTPPLRQVPPDYTPTSLIPEGMVAWLDLALRQSPTLRAREQALTVARMAVQRQTAGHYPRLDLIASMARSENESLSSLGQSATLRTVGVQLNVPLYNGGGVEASIKQALASQARAEEEIRAERENVELEVQRHYQATANGAKKIAAHRQAVASAALALEGSRRALEAGVGTMTELADAQAQLYVVQRDLAQARIDYLISRMRLMVQAGVPMADAAADLDQSLVAVAGTADAPKQP